MNITTTDTTKNTLLARTEVKAQIMFNGVTPSVADVQKNVAAKLSAEEARVVVKTIYTKYGGGSADVVAYVYDDEATQKRVEPNVKVKK